MRAAEAIRLGSLVIKPVAGKFGDENGGCAIGMGNFALSKEGGCMHFVDKYLTLFVSQIPSDFLPCGCPATFPTLEGCGGRFTISGTIIHLFDHHVVGAKDWTIDRLCEWLDSVDPTPRDACDMGASPLCEHKTEPQTNELELTR